MVHTKNNGHELYCDFCNFPYSSLIEPQQQVPTKSDIQWHLRHCRLNRPKPRPSWLAELNPGALTSVTSSSSSSSSCSSMSTSSTSSSLAPTSLPSSCSSSLVSPLPESCSSMSSSSVAAIAPPSQSQSNSNASLLSPPLLESSSPVPTEPVSSDRFRSSNPFPNEKLRTSQDSNVTSSSMVDIDESPSTSTSVASNRTSSLSPRKARKHPRDSRSSSLSPRRQR